MFRSYRPGLHAGLLSEAEVLESVLAHHSPRAAEKFVAEVFWRIYFKGYLEQRPSVWASFCESRDSALAAACGECRETHSLRRGD